MTQIQFTIPGKPFAKQRPRATAKGGFARVYTPKETVSFEQQVGAIAAPLFARPIAGPVRLRIIAIFEPAASWPKKKRAAHLHRPHTQKPDSDNVSKAIKDGLNRIAWADDSQVADLHVTKVWGNTACTQVWVEAMTDQED
ncbi:RusA family crossover junction endodeoxyribonuclease [Pararhodobacter sp. CCB-MM2]|uniref:RusA family crossover junction endodeoxyribonuclease n=1 Tax=Pararhodobacter sp. CCB-MM2 TaxID=1786003 RepID=UPI000832A182|nr:RusA family crossover junction endodeoxyribonuclease [Pararhodobacter sp. CCB-MM2]